MFTEPQSFNVTKLDRRVFFDVDSLFQEVLLGSNHRARSAHPDPGNGLTCREAVLFHQVTANQSARPAQTS